MIIVKQVSEVEEDNEIKESLVKSKNESNKSILNILTPNQAMPPLPEFMKTWKEKLKERSERNNILLSELQNSQTDFQQKYYDEAGNIYEQEILETPTMIQYYCSHTTREKWNMHLNKMLFEYKRKMGYSGLTLPPFPPQFACTKIHFVPSMERHTNPLLGDCSYLDTCKNKRQWKYTHYESELPPAFIDTVYALPKPVL